MKPLMPVDRVTTGFRLLRALQAARATNDDAARAEAEANWRAFLSGSEADFKIKQAGER